MPFSKTKHPGYGNLKIKDISHNINNQDIGIKENAILQKSQSASHEEKSTIHVLKYLAEALRLSTVKLCGKKEGGASAVASSTTIGLIKTSDNLLANRFPFQSLLVCD